MMRGMLLLLAGAAMIYLGFSGSDVEESTSVSGEPPTEIWQDASLQDLPGEPEEDGVQAMSGEAAAPVDPAQTPSNPTPEPDSSDEVEALEATLPTQDPSTAPRFELVGASADPVQLASILLDAWILRDPTTLGAYVNGEEGGALTPARREMVAAFWQAMVGKRESAAGTLTDLEGQQGVTSSELSLLAQAAEVPSARSLVVTRARRGALERSMQMILLEEDSSRALAEGRLPHAAVGFSNLIHAELEAPWPAHVEALKGWSSSLRQAQESHRLSKSGNWPGIEVVVRGGETLTHVRKRALAEQEGMFVCTGLIARVNQVKGYIHPNDRLRVPTTLPNVLVDLSARLVVYRHGEEAVLCFPCGIGREGKDTPLGVFQVGDKVEEPIWYQPNGPPIPFGSPENALGDRWIEWRQDGVKTSYGFHGTNDPNGVGSRVSRGCIRLRNEDVKELFELLPMGAEVVIQP